MRRKTSIDQCSTGALSASRIANQSDSRQESLTIFLCVLRVSVVKLETHIAEGIPMIRRHALTCPRCICVCPLR